MLHTVKDVRDDANGSKLTFGLFDLVLATTSMNNVSRD